MSSIRRRLNSVVFYLRLDRRLSSLSPPGAASERLALDAMLLVDRRAAPRARTRAMRPPTPTLRARARAPMPTKPRGEAESMSVDDTMPCARLGLAPLRRARARDSRRRERARRERGASPRPRTSRRRWRRGRTEEVDAPTLTRQTRDGRRTAGRARVVGEESRIDGE